MRYLRYLASVVILLCCLAIPVASHASTTHQPATALPEYAQAAQFAAQTGVSVGQAQVNIDNQKQAGDIGGKLEDALGDSYAGLWYDNQAGIFHLNKTPGADSAVVQGLIDKLGVPAVIDTVPHRWSTMEAELATTDGPHNYIDPATDIIHSDGSEPAVSEACTLMKYCAQPPRGGVIIGPSSGCTLGYAGLQRNSNNARVDLTAGHCTYAPNPLVVNVAADDNGYTQCNLGVVQDGGVSTAYDARVIDESHDKDLARTCGPDALEKDGYSLWILAWGNSDAYPIHSFGSAYNGLNMCHEGVYSGLACGVVLHADVSNTFNYSAIGLGSITVQHTDDYCVASGGGDSGGPMAYYGIGYGIHLGSFTALDCSHMGVADRITAIEAALGLHI